MAERGGAPTRAVTLSPRERAWVVDKLIAGGHTPAEVMAAVDKGAWAALSILPQDMRLLTCRSCGAAPYRDACGRLHMGCNGACRQACLADEKERTLDARMQRVARATQQRDPEEDSYASPLDRFHVT